ncbi:MAG: glycosyltransferase family 2 protein [Anaerolineales bacterium]|jgi:glycosyltransferase involved in cell wall biosynthesis
MSFPPVLVVMPLYNARPYVAQAVNSILAQTYPNFTLLIVDDGSTDGSNEVINTLLDKRILFIHQQHEGPGSAMNRGIAFAQEKNYPFLARMDADDISLPNRLEEQVRLLLKYPDMAACSANCYYIDSDTEQIIGASTVGCSPTFIRWEIRQGLRGLIQGATLFRTQALVSIGGYRETFKQSEETDLFLRLVERYPVTNSAKFLYKIRLRRDSLSMQNARENIIYTLYALDCARRRANRQPEKDFRAFFDQINKSLLRKIDREQRLLRYWRKSLDSKKLQKIILLFLSALIDPKRALARILRKVDTKFSRYC